MKKIIDGKRYDTETATEIANWTNGYFYNDFHYCEETLYKSPNGTFFIYGEGGAASQYRQKVGSNSYGGGDEFRIVSETEAQSWLEENGCTEALEEHFSDNIIDG